MLGGFGKGALKFVEVQLGAKIWILLRKSIRGVVLWICWHLQSSREMLLGATVHISAKLMARQGEKKQSERRSAPLIVARRRVALTALLLSQAPSELQSNVA